MTNSQLTEWLMENAGPVIRYRTVRELLGNKANDDLISELLNDDLIKALLQKLDDFLRCIEELICQFMGGILKRKK